MRMINTFPAITIRRMAIQGLRIFSEHHAKFNGLATQEHENGKRLGHDMHVVAARDVLQSPESDYLSQ